MKNKNREFAAGLLALSLLGAAALVGCDARRDERPREMTVAEMSPRDVIVSVNGTALTKGEVADKLTRVYKVVLRGPGGNPNAAAQTVREEQDRIVERFVTRRLIADTARQKGLIAPEELSAQITSNMTAVAKARKSSLADYERKSPVEAGYFRRKFEEDALMNAYRAACITPTDGITPEVVSNYLAEVDAENAVVAKTNALRKASLNALRAQAVANPEKWEELVAGVGNADPEEQELEYDEFDEAETAERVFRTAVGGITEPIEEEGGFRMVKVVAATAPGSTNSFGEVSARGTRTCSQVYVEKEPLFLKWDFAETEKELRRQADLQLLEMAVEAMKTNGLHRIEYPHGTNFWARPAPPPAKAETKAERKKETEKGTEKGS